jgi:hypothetical protein
MLSIGLSIDPEDFSMGRLPGKITDRAGDDGYPVT